MFTYHVYEDVYANSWTTQTGSFQAAIDRWSEFKMKLMKPFINVICPELWVEPKTLITNDDIKEFANYLMGNKYNRVEKRIMLDMTNAKLAYYDEAEKEDAMAIVEPQDDLKDRTGYDLSEYEYTTRFRDEIPDLMSKVFGGSEELKQNLDFHGKFEEMSEEEQDQIINPKHYKMIPAEAYARFPEGLEYMDLMEYILAHHNGVQAHLLGQVFKYSCRLGKKDAKLQDAKKIAWYADRLVKVIENEG